MVFDDRLRAGHMPHRVKGQIIKGGKIQSNNLMREIYLPTLAVMQ